MTCGFNLPLLLHWPRALPLNDIGNLEAADPSFPRLLSWVETKSREQLILRVIGRLQVVAGHRKVMRHRRESWIAILRFVSLRMAACHATIVWVCLCDALLSAVSQIDAAAVYAPVLLPCNAPEKQQLSAYYYQHGYCTLTSSSVLVHHRCATSITRWHDALLSSTSICYSSTVFLSCSFLRILGSQHERVVLTLCADCKQPALFEKCKRGRDAKSAGEMFQPRGKTQWDGKRGERRVMRRSQLKMERFIFSQGWKQETENRAENLKDAERKIRRGENIEQFHAQNAGVKAGGREEMRGRSGDFKRGHSVQAGGMKCLVRRGEVGEKLVERGSDGVR